MKSKKIWLLVVILLLSSTILLGFEEVPGEKNERKEPKYTVKEGDTLWDISEEYLRNPLLWPNIWRKNPRIKNPHLIFPGEKILIPEVREKAPAEILSPTGATVPVPEARSLSPGEGTIPASSHEGTVSLPEEGTFPLIPIEKTLPVLPEERPFLYSVPPEREKEYVGMGKCRECHIAQFPSWDETIHAKWSPGLMSDEKKEESKIDCETCHGPGSLHVRYYKDRRFIVSFGPISKNTVEEQNKVCLGCHDRGGLYSWNGSVHGRTLGCSDCHVVMKKLSPRYLLKNASEKDICYTCHRDIKGRGFRSPHLSQAEAKMTCSTCHNPHGSETPALLKASSINENCYACHQDKRGPYLYDHLPVSENCLLCHKVHGSSSRWLLKVREPFLCLECHTNLPTGLPSNVDPHDVFNPGSRFTYNRGCTNCHPMIHGSRHPSGAVLQR